MRFLKEFQAFAMRGNVIDLAVAVVMGAAFNKIVGSLVDGIVMPFIGLLIGGVNIADKSLTIGQAVIKWGMFLQSIIDFALIAFSIFMVIKAMNTLRLKKDMTASAKPSDEVLLLGEIRDLLKSRPMTADSQ
ncbi:Large-conductance mechanosensitive channel [Aquicella siphonis]|uniref:Large-conductance mechanosensitive channel n=1 Tax=Aquicella siphonis TaxID=254247 RepID=A0A5E4PE45_9COXI|nr:large-conductance mechanosensitive channel protein MscL [Aquicella siphonis]VVC74758.1 Large-conductance mechanosensitive channel [Aquicella siphonis]